MITQSKQQAFDLFEAHRAEYLAAARSFMEAFAADGRAVTVNDLIQHGPPLPDGVDPRVRGAVFAGRMWERLGYAASSRRASHCRPVQRFRLKLGCGA
jgi:hypothetical protein